MQQWLDQFNFAFENELSQDNAAQTYADLHLDFVSIHPFFDGNGRMARLLANLPVLKSGFPPIVIPAEDRKRYKDCISAYQETVSDLAKVKDINAFQDNAERNRFRALCANYWGETMILVENARKIQFYRDDHNELTLKIHPKG